MNVWEVLLYVFLIGWAVLFWGARVYSIYYGAKYKDHPEEMEKVGKVFKTMRMVSWVFAGATVVAAALLMNTI